jgi:uncharacterized protein YbjQ (UPF0145 family)
MMITTLPDLPGQQFTVKGFVYAHDSLGGRRNNMQQMVQSLIQQGEVLGANGIVDLTTIMSSGGGFTYCVMTGTAVLITGAR